MFDFWKSKPAQPPKLMKTARFLKCRTYKTNEMRGDGCPRSSVSVFNPPPPHQVTVTHLIKRYEWAEARRIDSTRYQVFDIFDEGKGSQEGKFIDPTGQAVFSKDEAIAALTSYENKRLNDSEITIAQTPEQTGKKHFSRYVTQGAQPTRPNGGTDTPKGPEPA